MTIIFQRYLARQLSNPTGIVGKFVLGPLWNKRNAQLNEVAFARLELKKDDRVLDIGFGGGYLLERMATVVTNGFLAGVDVSETMVSLCERRYKPLVEAGRLEVKCAAAELIPYPSGHFSKVCTVNSLFYWKDTRQAMSELCRVLEKGGRLVVCLTCKKCLENRSFARHGIILYEDNEVCRIMGEAGFERMELHRASDRHREFVCIVGEK